jgi:hypothetical protein
MLRLFVLLAGLAAALPAAAALNVFACEPEWAALVKELGGDKVSAWSATHALQDPHRIEARPSLIARARNAQLVVCTGADLEAGWLPPVLRESGNAAVQPGRPGYFEAAQFVAKLEIPARLDRSEGDVHASRATRTSSSIRATCWRWPGPWRSAWASSMRRMPGTTSSGTRPLLKKCGRLSPAGKRRPPRCAACA